ncbi:hypothetical protein LguiA_024273 [Lonicera macranthoides]
MACAFNSDREEISQSVLKLHSRHPACTCIVEPRLHLVQNTSSVGMLLKYKGGTIVHCPTRYSKKRKVDSRGDYLWPRR